jgi:YbbR domain-containing protein
VTAGGSGWTWLIDHWRLKLLAVFLAVILFGTVAFAQNPITVRTISVKITSYEITDQSLVLIDFPTHVVVHAVGLANAVDPLSADDIAATMDLSKLSAPSGPPKPVRVAVSVQTATQGVTLQESSIPVLVTLDSITSVTLPIEVTDEPQPGTTIDSVAIHRHGTNDTVSSVAVTGAASLLDGLKAFVDLGQIAGSTDVTDKPIQFRDKTGKTVKWPPPTIPLGSLDISSVDANVVAHQTQQQKDVAAVPSVTGTPACGYAIAGITVTPSFVTLSGDVPSLNAAGTSIALNSIDITGATGNVSSSERVTPPGNVTVAPGSVRVTIQIKQIASCTAASPPPPPSPTPQPTPT